MLGPRFAIVVLAMVTVTSSQNTTLKHVHIIARSGFSKPLTTLKVDSNNVIWNDVPHGYLTLEGKRSSLESGKQLRTQYADFLSQRVNDDETYMRSTDTNRALASAELLMAGLYPPTDSKEVWAEGIGTLWQPTPVHTIPLGGDPFGSNYAFKFCPKFLQLVTIFSKTPEAQRQYERAEKIREVVEKEGSFTWKNIIGFLSFGDIIERQVALNVKFDDWLEPHVPEILELYHYFIFTLVEVPELRRLAGGPVMYEIMNRISKIAKRKITASKKMFIYMTHANTLMYVLSSLYAFDKIIPPFDARLHLELHQDTDHPNKYYIKALYKTDANAEPIPLKLPGCPNNFLCSWQVVHQKTQKNFVTDIRRRCRHFVFLDQWSAQMKFNLRYP